MYVPNCIIKYVNWVKFVDPAHLADVNMPAADRAAMPRAEGGVPAALQVIAEAPSGDRFTMFLHRGPRIINPQSESRWGGETLDTKLADWVRQASKDGTVAGTLGMVHQATIDLDENGNGSGEMQWIGPAAEGAGAALEEFGDEFLSPVAATSAA
jgi:hypothetical protein